MEPIKVDGLQKEVVEEWATSSKGNQNKWFQEIPHSAGCWYKEDGLGYEALSEVLVSRLLEKTNVRNFVRYQYAVLERNQRLRNGCRADNFMGPEDERVISVERLFQAYRGESAAMAAAAFAEPKERIRFVAEGIEEITGLTHFGEYIRRILTVDALFLNEDRHFHNLAVIQRKDGTYRECPIFDNGAALFSDTREGYPLELDASACMERVRAKPFSMDFDEQLEACELLYGGRFRASFTMEDVNAVLKEFEGVYEERVLGRVRETMQYQIRKYAYLF